MKTVVTFGDLMLSLTPPGYQRFLQASSFEAFYTGAEANVAASLAQFGQKVRFVTRLPENAIGDAAVANLRKFHIETDFIVRGGERVGIVYTEKGAAQRASTVIYDRRHSAIATAPEGCFNWEAILEYADWFHFTGITPALSEMMTLHCLQACKYAKMRGITVSCDLNFRNKLWTPEQAQRTMTRLMEYVDVLIANEEDAEKVLGIKGGNSDVMKGTLDHDGYIQAAEKIRHRDSDKS